QVIANWSGDLTITDAGNYAFDVYSNGGSIMMIDGQTVVDNSQVKGDPTSAHGVIDLKPGAHRFQLRYNWTQGTGYLEAYITTPGMQKSLIGPDILHTNGGVWLPGTISDPPGYRLP